jgi:hypothetical protein
MRWQLRGRAFPTLRTAGEAATRPWRNSGVPATHACSAPLAQHGRAALATGAGTQAGQFAVDAPVPSGRVVARRLQYQRTQDLRRADARECGAGMPSAARYLTRRPWCTREDQVNNGDTILGIQRCLGLIVDRLSRRSATGLVASFPCGDRTCSASVYCALLAPVRRLSLPPAVSPDPAAAGHVTVAYSQSGKELGQRGGREAR